MNFRRLAGKELIENLKSIDWDKSLRLKQNETNKYFRLLFNIFEIILDTHAP